VSRDPSLFLEDIEHSCTKIVDYTRGLSRDETFADTMRLDAILMNLHVIGEAVKNLPDDLRERYKEVPWRQIAGMRDFVAHVYFAIDLDILWDTITNDVPALRESVMRILESESRSGDPGAP
jgi:uncharacterized protein with HEPN domain